MASEDTVSLDPETAHGEDSLWDIIEGGIPSEQMKSLLWEGTLREYVGRVAQNPNIARNAYQRIYDMIMHFGTEEITLFREPVTQYVFFSDPIDNGRDAVFGLDKALGEFVGILRSAANGFGAEKRIILLHGPVGSAKSTIARLIKKGLEYYSRLDEGALYSFGWKLKDESGNEAVQWCPMHEEPLKLVPKDSRQAMLERINRGLAPINKIRLAEGDLCPFCRMHQAEQMQKHGFDFDKMTRECIVVKRIVMSEKDRVGIGTFQPKDEKNQDSTELTGDINYRKIAEYGSDSDPRAFNFDGELNIANRGVVEFIEVLKLDVAFLYDLLGASQEHMIKPKKFAQTDIDEVIIGHTNEPEYKKLQGDAMMEAFRDRTIKVDIPYSARLRNEIRIYEKDFNPDRIPNIHIAPHTIEVAAMWAILTRLEAPKKANLTVMQKLRLYDGKEVPGYTEDGVRELIASSTREGMEGISPRYIQDKISNALVSKDARERGMVNPFMVMNELEAGLMHHSLISDEEVKKEYLNLLGTVKEEYDDMLKAEVQRAISADEEAIDRLCGNYIDNLRAYTQKETVRDKYTGKDVQPDERLMRSIEEKIDIPEANKDDFRQEIMNYIGALSLDGKKFTYRTNNRLQKALELKLFEDHRDSIKLKNVVTGIVDDETQKKIDIVKRRLCEQFGYNDASASDVLNYVASIFARGDSSSSSKE